MKGRVVIALLGLFILTTCAFYVSAQQPDTTTREYQKAREAFERLMATYQSGNNPYSVESGIKAPMTPVTLCMGPVMATDGTAKCLYQALLASGTLRIEMQDGTTHEIDLRNAKQMTVK